MTDTNFEASRLKVWRAGLLLEGLDFKILAYQARKPAHANIRPAMPPKDAGMVYHETIVTEAIPITWSATIGDIIHNLRAALDLLACDLVRTNGGSVDDVYFPFAKNAGEFEKALIRRNVDRAKPEVIDLLRSLKPYTEEGNEYLRGLHDLDIIDKHRRLLLSHGMITIPKSTGDPIVPTSGVQFDQKRGVGMVSRGYTRADTWPIGENLPVVFHITLPQEGPFAGQPVIQTLEKLAQEVSKILDDFEKLCFGSVTTEFPWARR